MNSRLRFPTSLSTALRNRCSAERSVSTTTRPWIHATKNQVAAAVWSCVQRQGQPQQRCSFATRAATKSNPLGIEDDETPLVATSDKKKNDPNNSNDNDNQEDWTPYEKVLFQRDSGSLTAVRTGFASSCFVSVFTLWYTLDFVPAMNGSGIEAFQIPAIVPTIFVGVAVPFQMFMALFPLCLIHKLSLVQRGPYQKHPKLLLYNHTLPMVRPNPKPQVFSLGTLKLDPSFKQTLEIVKSGDISKYSGYVPIYKDTLSFLIGRVPWLLNIGAPTDVREPKLLLQSLLQLDAKKPNKQRTPNSSSFSTPKYTLSSHKRPARGGGAKPKKTKRHR